MPCGGNEERKPKCKEQSVVYESSCKLCNKDGKHGIEEKTQAPRKGIYLGKTRRSLSERSKEHVQGAKDVKEGNHMVKHWINYHPEKTTQPEFRINIKKAHTDCLSRQVTEVIHLH